MKLLLLLGFLVASAGLVQAQCKACGCMQKCKPSCECKHDKKTP
jgi:hypothetical protein